MQEKQECIDKSGFDNLEHPEKSDNCHLYNKKSWTGSNCPAHGITYFISLQNRPYLPASPVI